MHKPLKYILLSSLTLIGSWLVGSSAWSNCACFCMEGQLTTLCTAVGEAQNSPDLCPAHGSCPSEAGTADSAGYAPPDDNAVNCRDVRVYDAIRGEYVTAKACDVI